MKVVLQATNTAQVKLTNATATDTTFIQPYKLEKAPIPALEVPQFLTKISFEESTKEHSTKNKVLLNVTGIKGLRTKNAIEISGNQDANFVFQPSAVGFKLLVGKDFDYEAKDQTKSFSLIITFHGADGSLVQKNITLNLQNVQETKTISSEKILEKLSNGTTFLREDKTETFVDGKSTDIKLDTLILSNDHYVPLSKFAKAIENWTKQAGEAGQVLGDYYDDGFFPKNIEKFNDDIEHREQWVFRNKDNGHEITFLEMTRMYRYYKEAIRKFGADTNMSALSSHKTPAGIGFRSWIKDWVKGSDKSPAFLARIIHRGVEECRIEQKKFDSKGSSIKN